ncbi:hypothetical protein [Cupriavidus pinatubonensis]|uniref:hypothetical protein n=1 Tax=Cupriavidus pinatubonensis TaxID=248026 RepID=UPI00112E09DE|nr:hypothetical protein [Cupriavidus pinatubonensis]TPQ40940.1 hypothetical protein C2U69_08855 [Cupriavidus pinatubonensis]
MSAHIKHAEPTFPALHFLVKHGNTIALLLALSMPIIGMWFWTIGGSPASIVGSIIAGAFGYLIMRSYVDLVRLVADAMLPK